MKSFVLFWFFGFYFRMSIMSGTLTFRPFSKRWNYSENFKTINVVLNFTRSVKTRPIINLDCKTVGFFLNAKIRTVLQSIINSHMPTKKSVTLQSLSLWDFTSIDLHVHQVNFLFQERQIQVSINV